MALYDKNRSRKIYSYYRFAPNNSNNSGGSVSSCCDEFLTASGDLTGVSDHSAIQNTISSGGLVILNHNQTYYLSEPLIPASGASIICFGEAIIKQGSSWANASSTDVENALIKMTETEAATTATTVATTALMDSPSIVITSATGFAANGLFKISGTSGGFDYYESSTGNPSEEVLQVSSGYVSGTTITLTENCFLHHGANGGAKPVQLLDAIVENVTLIGIKFDVYGAAVASAIYGTFVRNITIENCSFKGFTGRAIHFRGSKHIAIDDCNGLGANNGRVQFYSCQNSYCRNWKEYHEVNERFNTRGSALPLPAFMWRSQCRAVEFIDCTAFEPVAGFYAWGGIDCHIKLGTVIRADLTALLSDQSGLFATESDMRGIALDTGCNELVEAEFGFQCTFQVTDDSSHIGSSQHYSTTDVPEKWHCIFYLHDHFRCAKVDLLTTNKGAHSYLADRKRYCGAMVKDFEATSGTITLNGVYAGITTDNVFAILSQVDVYHNAKAGAGVPNGFCHLYLCGGLGLNMRSLMGAEASYPIVIGPVFDSELGYRNPIVEKLTCENLTGVTLKTARNVMLAKMPDSSTKPTLGVAYKIDPAGTSTLLCTAANAIAGDPAVVSVSSTYGSYSGVLRHFAAVHLHEGCTTPMLTALTSIAPGAILELDVNGKATQLTAITPGEVTRCIGRNNRAVTVAGELQIGQ